MTISDNLSDTEWNVRGGFKLPEKSERKKRQTQDLLSTFAEKILMFVLLTREEIDAKLESDEKVNTGR